MTAPSKSDTVALLAEIAGLLEFAGENAFKVRAFENAARALGAETATLEGLVEEPGRLEGVKGIGKSIAAVIREFATNGQSETAEELRAKAPDEIGRLMQIPNLGPKKLRAIHGQLGVSTVDELEAACKSGAVAGLARFGEKSAAKILEGIDQVRRFSGQWLYSQAEPLAHRMLDHLRACPEVIRCEVAGSFRRRKEIVRDLDFLASSSSPQAVTQHFVKAPGVVRVVASGETKTSVMLDNGMQADLRVMRDGEYAPALHYFTGSREHNTQLRALARKHGMRLNEYGLFREAAGTQEDDGDSRRGDPVKVGEETEIFGALGLSPIAPELREGMGEIEAAAEGKLPRLIESSDYRGVLHCHSTWSDGTAGIREMALAAREMGWEYFGVADHSEAAAYAQGVKRERVPEQHAEIDALNRELEERGIRILKGCECDILADGSLDYSDEILAAMDYVVASVHSRFGMSGEEMTARLLRAVENPHTTILGHISGRLLLEREPYRFDTEAVLKRAGECGTLVEINGDPHRLDLDWRLCRRAKELGVRFSVNPDAHATRTLAYVAYGINCARKGWLTRDDVANCLGATEFAELVAALRQRKRDGVRG